MRTPGPWHARGQRIRSETAEGIELVFCPEATCSGNGTGYRIDQPEAEANAAYIVRMENGFDGLLEAADKAYQAMCFAKDILETMAILKTAIAKAKGE